VGRLDGDDALRCVGAQCDEFSIAFSPFGLINQTLYSYYLPLKHQTLYSFG
jgi:hypothetical protein